MKQEEIINKIQELYSKNKYDEIITFYGKAPKSAELVSILLERVNNWDNIDVNVELIVFRAILFSEIKEYDKSIDLLDKAININPNFARAYNNKGVVLFYLEKYVKSIEVYDIAIKLNPDYSNAYYNKGISLSRLGKEEEAIAVYDKVIKLNPEYLGAYYNKGNSLSILGKEEEAIVAYDKAIELNPEYSSTYINKGISFSNLGKDEEAIVAYNKAIELNPEDSTAYYNKGISLYNLGKDEEAIAAYDKAIALNPEDSNAYNNKGNSLSRLGKEEEAISAYDKAIELNPEGSIRYKNKGYALVELNRKNEAIESFNKFLERSSDEYLNARVKDEIKNLKENNTDIDILEKQIEEIKEALSFEGEFITHYTGLLATQTLTMDKSSSFRMSEANYMNDTAEGEKLKDFVLEPLNSFKQNKIPFIEKPFLASFVAQEKCNDLTLWRMYTKSDNIDGRGCAITLKSDAFLKNIEKTLTSSTNKNVEKDSFSKISLLGNEFCLYNVAYIDDNGKCIGGKRAKRKTINDAIEQIKTIFVKIKDDKGLIKIALERLSEIEYLFKGEEYQHEGEVRLILSKIGKQKHIQVSDVEPPILPRTYMNTGNIIDAIEAITIGPKVERPKEWAAAFNYKLQEFGKEEVSIYISQLPYK